MASALLKSLSKSRFLHGHHMVEMRNEMRRNADKFEHLAVAVVTRCHDDNPVRTAELLGAQLDWFGDKTAMEVAFQSRSIEFLSQTAAVDGLRKVSDVMSRAGDDSSALSLKLTSTFCWTCRRGRA